MARSLILIAFFSLLAPHVFAQGVKLTIYDDGFSCPADCDAHVVFHPSMNSTKYAHSPARVPGRFDRCTVNSECRICLDENVKDCINVMYRGGEPSPNRLDFTPAFYEKHCSQLSIPAALATKCNAIKAQARTLDGRVNCFKILHRPNVSI